MIYGFFVIVIDIAAHLTLINDQSIIHSRLDAFWSSQNTNIEAKVELRMKIRWSPAVGTCHNQWYTVVMGYLPCIVNNWSLYVLSIVGGNSLVVDSHVIFSNKSL